MLLTINGASSLSDSLTSQLNQALDEVEDIRPDIFIVKIAGVTASDKIKWPGDVDIQAVSRWEKSVRRMEKINANTVVFAQQTCSSLALELLLVADFRMCSSEVRIQIGASCPHPWPSMASYRLVHQIGHTGARRLFFLGLRLTATVLQELNITDETFCAEDDPLENIARALANANTDAQPLQRRLLLDDLSADFDDSLGLHLAACDRALRRGNRDGVLADRPN